MCIRDSNQTVGRRLAEGKSLQEILDTLGMVAEGVPNTLSVYEIARKLEVRTPLIDAVYSVLYESKPPMEALAELMTRDPKYITRGKLAAEALHVMESHKPKPITVLPVVDDEKQVIGLLHMTDLVRQGVV